MKNPPFYLPANLNLQWFADMKPPLKEKHLYLINLVCCKTYFQKFTVSERGFVNISFKEIEAVLSRKEIRPTKNKLIDLGILVENPSYSEGNYAKSYKLTGEYSHAELITYQPTSSAVVENFSAIRKSKVDYPKNKPELNFQYHNLLKLEIDESSAITYLIEQQRANEMKQGISDKKNIDNNNITSYTYDILHVYPFSTQTNKNNTFEISSTQNTYPPSEFDFKTSTSIENTKRFKNKDLYFTNNNASGRLYNSFTGIKRELRDFIYISSSDKLLHHLDLSNSQPFLLNYYLTQHYGSNPPKDVLDYINLTSTGQLYEYIQAEANPSNLSRDDLKKSIMKDLFFKATHYTTELEKTFQKRFPNVYNLIQLMKQKDYRLFSIELQRLESKLFVHLIGDELRKDNIFFLTVHDSVYFHSNNETIVRNAILSEFNKFELSPHLKS